MLCKRGLRIISQGINLEELHGLSDGGRPLEFLAKRAVDCKRKYYKKRWFLRRSEMGRWGVTGLFVGGGCTYTII
jgi:hypothetical protein